MDTSAKVLFRKSTRFSDQFWNNYMQFIWNKISQKSHLVASTQKEQNIIFVHE